MIASRKNIPGRFRKRGNMEDEGAYQVDLVVAFFAILLVLFVVYSAHAYSELSETSRYAYRPKDEHTQPFRLRSFAAVYPFRSIWIVRNGKLYHLSTRKLAKQYMKDKELDVAYSDHATMHLYPKTTEGAGLFTLKLLFTEQEIPAWMLAQSPLSLPPKDNYSALEALAKSLSSAGKSLIFLIFQNQAKDSAPLLAILSRTGIPFDIYYLPRRRKAVAISRRLKHYDFFKILRPY